MIHVIQLVDFRPPCAGDVERDFWLAFDLLRSPKDHAEFMLVRDWIAGQLADVCSAVQVEAPRPSLCVCPRSFASLFAPLPCCQALWPCRARHTSFSSSGTPLTFRLELHSQFLRQRSSAYLLQVDRPKSVLKQGAVQHLYGRLSAKLRPGCADAELLVSPAHCGCWSGARYVFYQGRSTK